METTPRINSALLPKYRNRTVRLTGFVLSNSVVTATDNGQVNIMVPQGEQLPVQSFCEIIGRVNQDNSVSASAISDLGPFLDVASYDAMIFRALEFPHVFGW